MPENYGNYITKLYRNGAPGAKRPGVTADFRDLEEQARHALGARAFNYIAGGAGEKSTTDSNRLAFRQWKM
jgi:hypothetical protein